MRILSAVLTVTLAIGAYADLRIVNSDSVGTIYPGPVADADWGRPLGAGDFDGDGFDDIVVAACESFGSVFSTVHVVRGGPAAHGRGVQDLAVVPADLVITGAQVDDNLGASIAAGDVNGDLIDDLLLVASTADYGGISDRGIAYLLYGSADFFASPTRDLAVTANWDLRILGPVAAGDMGGSSLFGGSDAQAAAIGNLNGDAYGDIALGVHLADGDQNGAGRVYVRYGGPFPSGITLNLATSSNYHVQILGAGELDELGAVVKTGDITGDGIDELILPNEYWSAGLFTSEGAVHIFRGDTTWDSYINLATTNADITLRGDYDYDNLGESAAVGDFNGDSIVDLAAAAPGADVGTPTTQRGDGIIYCLLGDPAYQTGTHVFNFTTDSADFTFVGEFEENLGTLVTSGDYNGDGIDDIAAAERFAGPSTNGVVEVLLGRDFPPGAVYAANADTDVRIVGAPSDRIGFWLTTANTNGDALDEVVFSTPFNNNNAGTAYVYTYVSADYDSDRDLDLMDFGMLQPCIETVFATPPTLPCVLLDFSLDEQVTADDLPGLEANWTEPN